jgi:uncharacterized protein involved in response to NO
MMPALWSSGFRPFFLLGAAYGPLVLLLWGPMVGELADGAASQSSSLWHGHEMLFGFTGAFICGFVLTALPSWAGTPEIRGRPLKLLVGVWIAGRAAAWSEQWLWPGLVGALDLLLFVSLATMVLPQLVRVVEKRYLALLPILFGLIFADAMYHAALWNRDVGLAEHALLLALNVLTILFAIIAGILTPIFTETALRERGREVTITRPMFVELAAIGSVILFAAADWASIPASVNGAIACLAAVIHCVRFLRWRTREILSTPIILAMHVGYAWLVVAMALRGVADAFDLVPRTSWIHAFTVGAVGMMMLAFLNRVALRHTGRAVALSQVAIGGFAIMFGAGLLRVGASVFDGGAGWMAISALAWAAPFVLFLCKDGSKLWQPSLPREYPAGTRDAVFKE